MEINNIKLPSKTEIEKIKSEKVDELYNNPIIKEYLMKNNYDSKFVYDNLLLLIDMASANEHCLHCPGYLKCQNIPAGYQKIAICDENGERLEYCRCSKLNEIYSIKEKYLVYDFKEDWLYNNLQNLNKDACNNTVKGELIECALNPVRGIYLYGKSGTGKSYIISALTNEIIANYGYQVAFVNFKNMLEDIKNNFDDDSYCANVIKKYSLVDVLVLDDLGGEKSSEWTVQSILFEIVNERMHNHKLTFFTSMYSLKQLTTIYGGSNAKTQRVIDCIDTLGKEVLLEGINFFKF